MAADINFITICLNCTQAGESGKVTYNHKVFKEGIRIDYYCFNCKMKESNAILLGKEPPAKDEKDYLKRIKNRRVSLRKVN